MLLEMKTINNVKNTIFFVFFTLYQEKTDTYSTNCMLPDHIINNVDGHYLYPIKFIDYNNQVQITYVDDSNSMQDFLKLYNTRTCYFASKFNRGSGYIFHYNNNDYVNDRIKYYLNKRNLSCPDKFIIDFTDVNLYDDNEYIVI